MEKKGLSHTTFLKMHAIFCIENDVLTYNLHTDHQDGFMMKYAHEEKLGNGSIIILIIPHFKIFITGDLSFYADVLGMPKSSSYWCPWCLLSRVEWQQSADNEGEKRTAEFLHETYEAVRQDTAKRMQPTEWKGVTCSLHYKTLGPDDFVPPLLHMEMGLVNQVWDDVETWIDDEVERIPVDENTAQKSVFDAKERLDAASKEKEEARNTICIEIKQKNAEVKTLKRELKKKGIADDTRRELNSRLALLSAMIKEQQLTEKNIIASFKESQEAYKQCKKQLEDIKAARGKSESSIVADVELTLAKFLISRAVYNGGNFNGVCCRRLVQHAKEIIGEIKPILVSKKKELL
jgi:hypothetical protein